MLLPKVGRHLFTKNGREYAQKVTARAHQLSADIHRRLDLLSLAGEQLKAAGLPASEASRMRQFMAFAIDALLNVEVGWLVWLLRSFACVLVCFVQTATRIDFRHAHHSPQCG
jgi:hypothetical protein